MADHIIPDVGFGDNTNQRTPCVLVLDASRSMLGDPIDQLNAGLATLESQLKGNPLTALRVQVLVIQIGGHDEVEVVTDWCDAMDFSAPRLQANGNTPLGKGVALALDQVETQKDRYDANGISSTRPWVMIISDGAPTDEGWRRVAEQCRQAERRKKCVVFPIGTEKADFEALSRFSVRKAKHLDGLNFRDLFVWLSRSMTAVSQTAPGEDVQLPAADWTTIGT